MSADAEAPNRTADVGEVTEALPVGLLWSAPRDHHPARRASQRSYAAVLAGDPEAWVALYAPNAVLEDPVGPSMFDPEGLGHRGHAGIRAFWEAAIAPISAFEFSIRESYANPGSSTCANVGQIKTTFEDGSFTVTELVMVYLINDAEQIVSMRAFWEPERTMASFTSAPVGS